MDNLYLYHLLVYALELEWYLSKSTQGSSYCLCCQFLLKNWTSLGAIISCNVHPCENHSGQPFNLGYLVAPCQVGKEPSMSWRKDASWMATTTFTSGKAHSPTKTHLLPIITMLNLPLWGWKVLPCIPKGYLQGLIRTTSDSSSRTTVSSEVTPTWMWTTRASPRAGKSFQVPSVPTACSKDSPRAIQWIISIFHAFKAQLAPQAISLETGQVLPDYVKLYQNNMLVHLQSQQAQSKAKVKPTPPQTMRPLPGHPSPPQLPPGLTIADLLSQIEALQSDFEEFKHTHKASSSEASSSPSSSPQAVPTVLPNDPPFPPPSTLSLSIAEESIAHPSHTWLQPIIDHRLSPTFIHCINSSMVPIFSHAMPDNMQQVLMVNHSKASPWFLGVDSNGDLHVSAQCLSEYVKMLINLTEDDPQPPPVPSVFRL